MRRFYRLLIVAVIVPLTSLLVVSCKDEKPLRIGVSQCSDDDWRSKMNEEVMLEAMLHDNVEVEIRSADDNNEKQIADIRYFADNGFDIIIVAPNEAQAITPVITEVYERGIPVIIFDRNVNNDSYTARIGTDNREIGRSAGRYALHLFSGLSRPIKVLEIYGLAGSSPAVGRRVGFDEVVTAGGGEIAGTGYGNWNLSDAERVTDSLLTLHPDVDLIYAHNDRMAIGAAGVAHRRGLDNIKIIGIDAAPNIGMRAVADSVIDATFLYPTEGHLLVNTALDILQGRPYSKETTMPASSAVDLSNVDILMRQNQTLDNEVSKMKALKKRVDDFWSKHSAQTSLFYASIVILLLVLFLLFMVLRAFWQRKRHQLVLMDHNRRLEEQSREQKRLADSRAELNDRLQEAIQSKLAFYTNVSHDLRTPLTLIAEPIAQLAKSDNLTSRQRDLLALAGKNTRILARLINQILDFRKFENDKLRLNLTEVDLTGVLAEWTDSFREVARRRDIRLTLHTADTEHIQLALDAEKMERVFFNLVANAIKYTPDNGSIDISYSCDGETLTLVVADTGIGIPAAELGNIFDQFFLVDKVRPQGSGIGLSLVKAFVEMHKGSITVDSQEGKGSVFTVRIPVTHISERSEVPESLISEQDINIELAGVGESDAVGCVGEADTPPPHTATHAEATKEV
ncbi:MAG: substrate-binding domain-containing protein, partial [Muribaculaceae bacterium]|nr:substrate-binding domain-containing protein [Muribaculaceae bacterium]